MSDINSVISDVAGGDAQASSDSSTDTDVSTNDVNNEQHVQDQDVIDNDAEQDSTQEDEEGDTTKNETDKTPPFHKHPRFKELINKVNTLQQENEKLRSQSNTSEEGKQNQEGERGQDNDREYKELVSQLPVHSFKTGKDGDDYASYDELYQDIRKAVLTDLAELNRIQVQKERSALETSQNEFRNTLTEIETDLDDKDKFSEFKRFATEVYKQDEFQQRPPDLRMVYATYLKEIYNKPWDGEQKTKKKPGSKVSKSSKPTLGKSNKPGYKFIQSASMQDIADAMLGN